MEKYTRPFRRLLLVATLLAAAGAASAQNIYKCPHGKTVEYTDSPCARPGGELIHKADVAETIDYLLNTGKADAAERYATEHGDHALYESRLAAYKQRQKDSAAKTAAAALSLEIEAAAQKQQQLSEAQRDRAARLQAQNDLLRDQNADYRDQLQQQPLIEVPAYSYGTGLGYYGRRPFPHGHHGGQDRDHDGNHGHDHGGHHENDQHGEHGRQPQQPGYHPCTQLAGGRVQC